MASTTLFLILLCIPALTLALDDYYERMPSLLPRASARNVPPAGYYDPNSNGGSLLTVKVLGGLEVRAR